MKSFQFSVIIPAANEEDSIAEAILSVRSQGRSAEVIVVVNGSTDRTAERARAAGAQTLLFPELLGSSLARNEGAKRATGNTLVFLDADSRMGSGVLEKIARHAEAKKFGTVYGQPDNPKLRYRLFFLWKNTIHRLGLFRGVAGGLLFFDAELFRSLGGYNAKLMVNEHADIITRALRHRGAYLYIPTCTAYTSMRRFEEQGLIRTFVFWCYVQLFGLSRKKRTKIGLAYAASHDQLFEAGMVRDMLAALWDVRRAFASLCVSAGGAVLGAIVLFASYYGPAAFIRDVFAERLLHDPSTPIIHTMLYVAASTRVHILALTGFVILLVSAVVFLRNLKDVRSVVAENLSTAGR